MVFFFILQGSSWTDWFVNLMSDPIWGYMRGINLILWILTIIGMYIVGSIFIKRSKSVEMESQKKIFLSYGLFFILMGVTRIMFILCCFFEEYYDLTVEIGYFFADLSFLPIIFTIERYMIKQTKRLFSIIGLGIALTAFYFIFDNSAWEVSIQLQTYGTPILMILFVFLYLWIVKNSTGAVRKKAMMTVIGMFVFALGVLADSMSLLNTLSQMDLQILIAIVPPLIFGAGIFIIASSQKIE